MLIKLKKIKIKLKIIKNLYIFFIKIGKQKKFFLKKKYLIKNCIINTWIKIKFNNNIFFSFGYSNSLIISGLIKILFKILNKNKKKNIIIFLRFNFFKILNLKFSNLKNNSIKKIFIFLKNIINYN